jgi:hypothetical protein
MKRYVANIIETYITLNVNVCLLYREIATFGRRTLQMEAVGSFETLLPTIQITRCHISDHSNLPSRSQNLK